jgi:hypothetical protein
MKKVLSFFAVALVGVSALAVEPESGRRSFANQWGSASRAVASKNQIAISAALNADKSSIKAEVPKTETPSAPRPIVDMREKEKNACMSNNIGIGNTFVWASRNSNTGNYSQMVEDVKNPENNVCFVRVEIKSSDAKISVSDIPAVYYEMGRTITCGSWADAKKLEGRILAAKKSARTWGTVAGAVGGAGVGVGAMELFGNRLIGGSVEGQKHLVRNNKDAFLRSQLLVYKEKNRDEYERFKAQVQIFAQACEDKVWNGTEKPRECDEFNYAAFADVLELTI